jgi:hypothetical protein
MNRHGSQETGVRSQESDGRMVRESQAWQRTLLRWKPGAWLTEDWMFFWAIMAVMGWIGLVWVWLLLNSLLNDLKHERGTKTSERPGGDGVVSLRVRGDVATDDAPLRGDPVQVPSAGVVVASEEERAAGGVSASGIVGGDGVGECGLNLMQGTRVVIEPHKLGLAGATPAPAPNLNLAGRSVSSGDPFCPTSLAFRPAFDSRVGARSNAEKHCVATSQSAKPRGMGGLSPAGRPDCLPSNFPSAGSRAGGRDAEGTGAVVDGSMAAPILHSKQKTAKGAKGA